MIVLDGVRLRRGPDILLDNASATLHGSWKVGLTGRNGCGKSSLLAMMEGRLDTDAGHLTLTPSWRLAVMEQEVPALSQPAMEYVLDGNQPLRAAQKALADAEARNDGVAIGNAHDLLDRLGAWTAEARAGEVLFGLGFSGDQQQLPVAHFSGGWRMRLNLARVLLADADLLLLDEPTNHLDLDAVLWLEQWLKHSPATFIMISHDRDFLDNVVDHILHIEHHGLTLYTGNYSSFERQRAEKRAQHEQQRDKQLAQAAHLQKFIDRFKAQATKAKQAQSRVKALEKLQVLAPLQSESPFQFQFPEPLALPHPMLDLQNAQCGYGENAIILKNINLTINPETRLGLLGPNGAGKSTLIKTLAAEITAVSGTRLQGPELVIGYFHQQQVDALPQDKTAFWLMQKAQPQWTELQVRNELGRYGFQGDDAYSPVSRFSGGEKSRLALGLLVQQKPGLLLLDEPANHLDLEMREALTLALQQFDGAVVLVSHDRHLLESTVDELVLIAEGKVVPWTGDIDDYAQWLKEHNNQSARKTESASSQDNKQKRQNAAQKRELLRPLKKQAEQLEKKLDACQKQLAAVEQSLADEALYQADKKPQLQTLLGQQAQLRKQHDELEEAWMEALTTLEEAELGLS